MTEGPCRMRKKMMKNELFYIHYPYRPELEHPDNVNSQNTFHKFILQKIELIFIDEYLLITNISFFLFYTETIKIQSCNQH